MQVIWTANGRDCWRVVPPTLGLAVVVLVIGSLVGTDVEGGAVGGWGMAGVLAFVFAVTALVRYLWWRRVIAGRLLAVESDRLLVVRPVGGPAVVWWDELREIRLHPSDRWPEWRRYPTFAWFRGYGDDRNAEIFTSPDLYAVTPAELARLAGALQSACAEHGVEFSIV